MTEHKVPVGGYRRIPRVRGAAAERVGKKQTTAEADLMRACVYRILPTLPPALTEILWRVDLTGQSLQDAARLANAPLGDARTRLEQARVVLQDHVRAGAMLAAAQQARHRRGARRHFKIRVSPLAGRASRLLRRLFQASSAT